MQEHRFEPSGPFADIHNLHQERRKEPALLKGFRQRLSGGDFFLHSVDGVHEHGVAERVAHDVQGAQNRQASGNQRSERAREARDRNVSHQVSDDRGLQEQEVDLAPVSGALHPAAESNHSCHGQNQDQPPPRIHKVCKAHQHLGGEGQCHARLADDGSHQSWQQERHRNDDAHADHACHNQRINSCTNQFTAQFHGTVEEIGKLVHDFTHASGGI